jgi:hypothetical protein
VFAIPRYRIVAVMLVATVAPLFAAERAPAQAPRRQQRLYVLQQFNALQQQQNAVQTALQQTTSLLQAASRQNGVPQQAAVPRGINFQQQQNALQIAIQQTNALLQASYRRNDALNETALRQLNTLQTALQQTIALQSAVPVNGQLSAVQLQLLSQEQTSLLGLLTSQSPPPSKTSHR